MEIEETSEKKIFSIKSFHRNKDAKSEGIDVSKAWKTFGRNKKEPSNRAGGGMCLGEASAAGKERDIFPAARIRSSRIKATLNARGNARNTHGGARLCVLVCIKLVSIRLVSMQRFRRESARTHRARSLLRGLYASIRLMLASSGAPSNHAAAVPRACTHIVYIYVYTCATLNTLPTPYSRACT